MEPYKEEVLPLLLPQVRAGGSPVTGLAGGDPPSGGRAGLTLVPTLRHAPAALHSLPPSGATTVSTVLRGGGDRSAAAAIAPSVSAVIDRLASQSADQCQPNDRPTKQPADQPNLSPPQMCMNRYYVAEGVRAYSQETWRVVLGDQGREWVAR